MSASTLSRIKKGKLPDVNSFAALVRWLEMPADLFLGLPSPSAIGGTSLLSVLLGGHAPTKKQAAALSDLVHAAHRLCEVVGPGARPKRRKAENHPQ